MNPIQFPPPSSTPRPTAQADIIDLVKERLDIDSDSELARTMGTSPAYVSHLRHNVQNMGPALIIRFHEMSGIPIHTIKAILGLPSLKSFKGSK